MRLSSALLLCSLVLLSDPTFGHPASPSVAKNAPKKPSEDEGKNGFGQWFRQFVSDHNTYAGAGGMGALLKGKDILRWVKNGLSGTPKPAQPSPPPAAAPPAHPEWFKALEQYTNLPGPKRETEGRNLILDIELDEEELKQVAKCLQNANMAWAKIDPDGLGRAPTKPSLTQEIYLANADVKCRYNVLLKRQLAYVEERGREAAKQKAATEKAVKQNSAKRKITDKSRDVQKFSSNDYKLPSLSFPMLDWKAMAAAMGSAISRAGTRQKYAPAPR
ncbi:MAG: hypothetical protein M1823_004166 [Watsoniomyces obsoletus]|nr:MAG: hypothetical protein M1823_004166 [Watsoniomyces obsoletus]